MKYSLKELHEQLGETHATVAKNLGIARAYYTQLLLGYQKPSLKLARKISRYFRIPLDDIIFPGEVGESHNVESENPTSEQSA
ncbi:MAG: helix-turn-helix transcriptional regulator [Desulfotomaculales bacterium]